MSVADDLLLGVEFNALYGFIHAWSEKTFGPASERGPVGPLKHLAKEAKEAADKPDDKVEYADCLIILLDACWRAGIKPGELLDLAHRKMDENFGRKWPKTANPDEPIEHDRTGE